MSEAGRFVNIIVPLPIRYPLTYKVPARLAAKITWGQRVLINLRGHKAVGIVWSQDHEDINPDPSLKIKSILEIIDSFPLLPPDLKFFLEWTANYYHHPLGQVVAEALPPGFFSASARRIVRLERNLFTGPRSKRVSIYEQDRQDIFVLTEEQNAAISKIVSAVRTGPFSPFLLFGVTGSGKTEVYLKSIEYTLDHSRGCIVLVPEISMTTQTVSSFVSRFGEQVSVFHSGLTEAERAYQWWRIRTGESRLVIGTRSALFAPVARLGLIVVDEEHDRSYKQEERFRYHARDMALLRAKQLNATVVLGSATPSVTSFYHATKGRYTLLSIKDRPAGRPLPSVTIVDRRRKAGTDYSRDYIRPAWLSEELYKAIGSSLDRNEQVMLFLNRRGYATYVFCKDCGYTFRCPNCDVSMTWHNNYANSSGQILSCHYCGYKRQAPPVCPECSGKAVSAVGWGTERIALDIQELFPDSRVLRLDRDTVTPRNIGDFIDRIRQHEVDVIVGTQMITKGHDFPQLGLVGVLWADIGLNFPEFNAAERTFQLLAQVAGRAGRRDVTGRVIIQTSLPEHYVLKSAIAHDYISFYTEEIDRRKAMLYPPFGRLIVFRITGKNESDVKAAAVKLKHFADRLICKRPVLDKQSRPLVTILGPAPAPLQRLKRRYRWHFMLKSSSLTALHTVCSWLYSEAVKELKKSVTIDIDIDPESTM